MWRSREDLFARQNNPRDSWSLLASINMSRKTVLITGEQRPEALC